MSLGSAASIRVGFFVGTRDLSRARYVAKTAFILSLGYALITSSLLMLGRNWIPSIYSNDLAVFTVASQLLIIVAIYQIVDCTQATMVGALRGYKDTTVPMVYSLVGFWVLSLPVGITLGFGYLGPAYGVYGFWGGLAFGLSLVCLLVGGRLYRTSNNERRILDFAAI
jgi:MATE family multidrug resistance protein